MKRREKPEETTPFLHFVLGGLKNGQEVVTPFWAQKAHDFLISKNPISKSFPGKAGGSHFLGLNYVRKRAKLTTVLGVFKFDPKDERRRVMSEIVVICCCCCCCCCCLVVFFFCFCCCCFVVVVGIVVVFVLLLFLLFLVGWIVFLVPSVSSY